MSRYRVGRKLGRTIYDGDRLIGMMDDVADAYWIVELMNRADATGETQPYRSPAVDTLITGPCGSCPHPGACGEARGGGMPTPCERRA